MMNHESKVQSPEKYDGFVSVYNGRMELLQDMNDAIRRMQSFLENEQVGPKVRKEHQKQFEGACNSYVVHMNSLAMFCLANDHPGECLKLLDECKKLSHPEWGSHSVDLHILTLNNLSCYHRYQGEMDQALEVVRAASKLGKATLEHSEHLPLAYLYCSSILSALGRHEASYKKAQLGKGLCERALAQLSSKSIKNRKIGLDGNVRKQKIANLKIALSIAHFDSSVEAEHLNKLDLSAKHMENADKILNRKLSWQLEYAMCPVILETNSSKLRQINRRFTKAWNGLSNLAAHDAFIWKLEQQQDGEENADDELFQTYTMVSTPNGKKSSLNAFLSPKLQILSPRQSQITIQRKSRIMDQLAIHEAFAKQKSKLKERLSMANGGAKKKRKEKTNAQFKRPVVSPVGQYINHSPTRKLEKKNKSNSMKRNQQRQTLATPRKGRSTSAQRRPSPSPANKRGHEMNRPKSACPDQASLRQRILSPKRKPLYEPPPKRKVVRGRSPNVQQKLKAKSVSPTGPRVANRLVASREDKPKRRSKSVGTPKRKRIVKKKQNDKAKKKKKTKNKPTQEDEFQLNVPKDIWQSISPKDQERLKDAFIEQKLGSDLDDDDAANGYASSSESDSDSSMASYSTREEKRESRKTGPVLRKPPPLAKPPDLSARNFFVKTSQTTDRVMKPLEPKPPPLSIPRVYHNSRSPTRGKPSPRNNKNTHKVSPKTRKNPSPRVADLSVPKLKSPAKPKRNRSPGPVEFQQPKSPIRRNEAKSTRKNRSPGPVDPSGSKLKSPGKPKRNRSPGPVEFQQPKSPMRRNVVKSTRKNRSPGPVEIANRIESPKHETPITRNRKNRSPGPVSSLGYKSNNQSLKNSGTQQHSGNLSDMSEGSFFQQEEEEGDMALPFSSSCSSEMSSDLSGASVDLGVMGQSHSTLNSSRVFSSPPQSSIDDEGSFGNNSSISCSTFSSQQPSILSEP